MNNVNNTSGYWQLNNSKQNNCNERMFFYDRKNGITNQERKKLYQDLLYTKKTTKKQGNYRFGTCITHNETFGKFDVFFGFKEFPFYLKC